MYQAQKNPYSKGAIQGIVGIDFIAIHMTTTFYLAKLRLNSIQDVSGAVATGVD